MHEHPGGSMAAVSEVEPLPIWPQWRAVAVRWYREIEYRVRVPGRSPGLAFLPGEPVATCEVLYVLLMHELDKHPHRLPDRTVVERSRFDEREVARLLRVSGWPRRRVQRIRRLRWYRSHIPMTAVADLRLVPLSWVLRLGSGSVRAIDVARGARALAQQGIEDKHTRSIQFACEVGTGRELIFRRSGGEYTLEDGNHLAVALAMQQLDVSPGTLQIPVIVGERHNT